MDKIFKPCAHQWIKPPLALPPGQSYAAQPEDPEMQQKVYAALRKYPGPGERWQQDKFIEKKKQEKTQNMLKVERDYQHLVDTIIDRQKFTYSVPPEDPSKPSADARIADKVQKGLQQMVDQDSQHKGWIQEKMNTHHKRIQALTCERAAAVADAERVRKEKEEERAAMAQQMRIEERKRLCEVKKKFANSAPSLPLSTASTERTLLLPPISGSPTSLGTIDPSADQKLNAQARQEKLKEADRARQGKCDGATASQEEYWKWLRKMKAELKPKTEQDLRPIAREVHPPADSEVGEAGVGIKTPQHHSKPLNRPQESHSKQPRQPTTPSHNECHSEPLQHGGEIQHFVAQASQDLEDCKAVEKKEAEEKEEKTCRLSASCPQLQPSSNEDLKSANRSMKEAKDQNRRNRDAEFNSFLGGVRETLKANERDRQIRSKEQLQKQRAAEIEHHQNIKAIHKRLKDRPLNIGEWARPSTADSTNPDAVAG